MAKQYKKQEPKERINNQIRETEVRLIGEDFDGSGEVYSIKDALQIAYDMHVDLVEVSKNATPPVCKLIDYKKYLYEQKKKKKEQEKKQKENNQDLKELRFGPNTDDHDYNFKLKHAINFLERGDMLKAYVYFKGREVQFEEKGQILLLKLANDLKDIALPNTVNPKLEGRKMTIIFRPTKKKK